MEETVCPPAHCSCCVQRESDPPSLSHYGSITPEKANYIAHIDANVQHTHDAIVKLLNQRAALNRKRNTFVPAVNLPPEVLTMIFEFACCPDAGSWVANMKLPSEVNCYGNGCPVEASAVTPLFIGGICSAWRNIAWGASQLWSSITLLYEDKNAETQAGMIDYWFTKSGERPLTVKLIQNEVQWCPIGSSTEVIDVIAEYAHRLHTVDLFLPGPWEDALIRIASCTPLLTRLSLRVSQYSDELAPPPPPHRARRHIRQRVAAPRGHA